MSEVSDRYRKVAAAFTERAAAVPEGGWDRPSPCEDWVARDIVDHLVEGSQSFVGRVGITLPEGPSAQDDPLGAWVVARDAVQFALDDPAVGELPFESPMGPTTLEAFFGMFGVGDVLVHTWDLARATGLDEHLDADEVSRLYALMEPSDEMLRQGTAFGPKLPVDPDADQQTKLLAFSGRQV